MPNPNASEQHFHLRSALDTASYAALAQGAITLALQSSYVIRATSALATLGLFNVVSTRESKAEKTLTQSQQMGVVASTIITSMLNCTLAAWCSPLTAIAMSSLVVGLTCKLMNEALKQAEAEPVVNNNKLHRAKT